MVVAAKEATSWDVGESTDRLLGDGVCRDERLFMICRNEAWTGASVGADGERGMRRVERVRTLALRSFKSSKRLLLPSSAARPVLLA